MSIKQATEYPLVHPLRPVATGAEIKHMVRGEGIYLQDTDGKTYLDGISGLWNVSLGYGHAGIRDAIIKQLDQLPFVNLAENNAAVTLEFARKLVEITPEPLVKVAYTCTGSESNELAIKLSRKYFQLKGKPNKHKFIVLDISYHGTYYGSMSASGIDREISADYGPKVPGFVFLPVPTCSCCTAGEMQSQCLAPHLAALEEAFAAESDQLAGVIVEPIIGSGGILPIPQAYMTRLRELCNQHDVLLTFDEVATGFGRTGRMFALEHYDVVPDILCLSKGINSGYLPLGAVLFSREINRAFVAGNCHIEHLSTQNGNPLACAAGLATVQALEEHNYCEKVAQTGALLKQELTEALHKHRNFSQVRGEGLMLGIELVKSKSSMELVELPKIGHLVSKLRQRGLLVYSFYSEPYTSGISLFPPFLVEESDVKKIVTIIKSTFDRIIL